MMKEIKDMSGYLFSEDRDIMDKMRAVSCVRDFLRVIERQRLKDHSIV